MFRTLVGLTIGALVVVALSSAAQAKPRAAPRVATVTAVIFSGRPDPSWTLSRSQTAQFRKRLQALPRASGIPADEAHRPGYNLGHLRVRLADPGWPDEVVTVDRGHVLWQSRKVLLFLDDPGRALEGWLKSTSPPGMLPDGAFDR